MGKVNYQLQLLPPLSLRQQQATVTTSTTFKADTETLRIWLINWHWKLIWTLTGNQAINSQTVGQSGSCPAPSAEEMHYCPNLTPGKVPISVQELKRLNKPLSKMNITQIFKHQNNLVMWPFSLTKKSIYDNVDFKPCHDLLEKLKLSFDPSLNSINELSTVPAG